MPRLSSKISIKIIFLMLAQVCLAADLAYPEAVYSLRNAMIFSKVGEAAQERTSEIAALASNQNLNRSFNVLAGEEARMAVEDFIRKDKDSEKVWVICGDMSGIRLMNTVYHAEILDVLIPMTVRILSDFLADNKYEGIAVRVGIRGDEIQIALSSKYSKEDIDRIRKKAQEQVAKSITGIFWVCKVELFEGGQLFDAASTEYSAISRYAKTKDAARGVLGDDLLAGLYKDQDGIFMVFARNPGEKLEESIDRNLERLNVESGLKGLEIKIDSNLRPFGLLSPRILFGAAQLGRDLEKASERAERILNVAKDFGIEGATDGLLSEEVRSYVDLERRTVFETPEEERKKAAGVMNTEEVSGVKIYPEQFDPVYLALGEKHLRPLLEDAMNLAITQGLVRARMQPVLVSLLDVRYMPKGKFREALMEAYPEQEDRIKRFRGQVDDIFGETVAFKYFNDAVKNMGLEKEGHGLGNEVLKAEAKAIIEEVLVKLDRHNILLFRGPPDNWWFVFLNPMGQEYSGDQKNMAEFVDKISESFNSALENLGLDVEVRLRMNVASSTDVGIAPFSIVNTVRHVAKSRMMERTRSFRTNGGSVVKIYDPKKRGDLNEELSGVRAEERLKAQGLLAENIVKAVKLREKRNAITQNDVAVMAVLEENGWLKGEGPGLAGNQEVLENGAVVYKILLPGSDRRVEVCLDPETVKLMKELPEGVSINIFGNQAIQMILGRGGVIAGTGELDNGDFDCFIENNSAEMVDDAIGRAIRARHPEHELQGRLTKNIFDYLTSGPFTVNRLVVKLTSAGNGGFTVGFGDYMDDPSAYDDLINMAVKIADKIKIKDYVVPDRAIQGLIYHNRYGMGLEPEALKFIGDTLKSTMGNMQRILVKGIYPSTRLDKLFKSAKDPGYAVEQLYQIGALEQPFTALVVDALVQTEKLGNVLGSQAISKEALFKLEEAIGNRNSGLLRAYAAVGSAL